VDGNVSGSYPIAAFCISGVEYPDFSLQARQSVNK
jgi:hypothetical protein